MNSNFWEDKENFRNVKGISTQNSFNSQNSISFHTPQPSLQSLNPSPNILKIKSLYEEVNFHISRLEKLTDENPEDYQLQTFWRELRSQQTVLSLKQSSPLLSDTFVSLAENKQKTLLGDIQRYLSTKTKIPILNLVNHQTGSSGIQIHEIPPQISIEQNISKIIVTIANCIKSGEQFNIHQLLNTLEILQIPKLKQPIQYLISTVKIMKQQINPNLEIESLKEKISILQGKIQQNDQNHDRLKQQHKKQVAQKTQLYNKQISQLDQRLSELQQTLAEISTEKSLIFDNQNCLLQQIENQSRIQQFSLTNQTISQLKQQIQLLYTENQQLKLHLDQFKDKQIDTSRFFQDKYQAVFAHVRMQLAVLSTMIEQSINTSYEAPLLQKVLSTLHSIALELLNPLTCFRCTREYNMCVCSLEPKRSTTPTIQHKQRGIETFNPNEVDDSCKIPGAQAILVRKNGSWSMLPSPSKTPVRNI